MNRPLVTVLMSVRNGKTYLRPAIDSILAQSFRDFTFLVIDNHSEDATAHILDGIHDPRLHRLRNDAPQSLTWSLNRGLGQISTRYIARMDADDVAQPERLERQVAFLEENPKVALVATQCDILMTDEEGERVLPGPLVPTRHDDLKAALAWSNPISHASVMYRAEAVRDCGGYPAAFAYAQDMALYLELIRKGYRLAALDEVLMRIRVHARQASTDPGLAELRAREAMALYAKAANLPDLPAWARRKNRRSRAGAAYRLGRALLASNRPLAALGRFAQALATDPGACAARLIRGNGEGVAPSLETSKREA